ncbi:MAG: hypothetical protein NC390_04255 [Fusobacterium sp.]|nr:hypothetical protein [Fusobacterium sp.]
MTEPVKPISSKTTAQPKAPAAPQESKKVKIGNVEFRKDQIESDKTRTYVLNGKKMNTVFVKPGVQIDFPDQTAPNKNPRVESIGLRQEWYNPDDSNIHINDLDGAKIYGAPNKNDYISLEGHSSGNEIFVDQKESWYINGDMRRDNVQLGPDTSENTVHMDEKDTTEIWYNQSSVYINDEKVKAEMERLDVKGKGTSEQEVQLKDALKEGYRLHKHLQK